MKELIKPNDVESKLYDKSVDPLSEGSCCSPNVWRSNCDKYCDGGATNNSTDENGDILF
jgi:hypothetical protein